VPSAQGRLNKTRHEHVPSLYRDPKVANAWPVKNSTIDFMTILYRFAKKMKPDNLSMAELIVWERAMAEGDKERVERGKSPLLEKKEPRKPKYKWRGE
jgi:hypothetical protein